MQWLGAGCDHNVSLQVTSILLQLLHGSLKLSVLTHPFNHNSCYCCSFLSIFEFVHSSIALEGSSGRPFFLCNRDIMTFSLNFPTLHLMSLISLLQPRRAGRAVLVQFSLWFLRAALSWSESAGLPCPEALEAHLESCDHSILSTAFKAWGPSLIAGIIVVGHN